MMPTTRTDEHSIRLPGLPAVARLRRFMLDAGPGVLLTTSERLPLFQSGSVFGPGLSRNPTLAGWGALQDKVIADVGHVLTPFPRTPEDYILVLEEGGAYPRAEFLERLDALGYERDGDPGYRILGDAVTVLQEDGSEVRFEFFGDELETITHADGERTASWQLGLTAEAEPDGEGTPFSDVLLQHLPGTVYLDAPELWAGEFGEDALERLFSLLEGRRLVSFGRDPLDLPEQVPRLEPLGWYRGRLSRFAEDAAGWLEQGLRVTVLLHFERTGTHLAAHTLADLPVNWPDGPVPGPEGAVNLKLAPGTQGGYLDEAAGEVLVSEELLYGHQGGRRLRGLKGRSIRDAAQLSRGDYLIHPDHGIGMFEGLEARTVVGVTRDYLSMRYAGNGRLYLPVELLPQLRRHPGTTDDPPRLSTLGTNEWSRARERARASAQELAGRLLRTYAERQVAEGTPLPPVPDWDDLIAANFPFRLTRDQERAVAETLADMEKSVPMDRLISGDVGYGKTEIAIRAAHRAVGNSKQVAVLVPTTILARQHFETFSERFRELPVTVRLLSRFQTDREAREIMEGLTAGTVDIVIGTHRLLAESVRFKDPGLLVIDEEHRFGVAQKEKLKALRANIDVLSLSATPIPRTLYMSLVGLRDVSRIMSPPEGRQPIRTVLSPYDPLAVRQAIMQELERGGKSFYIYDRVGSIGMRARTLQQLVPEMRIGVVHGQMETADIEEVMLNFEEGAYDLLLATTIVESGLDISGANTLIIERADRLGLAQLYQLRGRVGRRETEAWAHLFYPGRLTEDAQRRLYAIAELNDLGSGHLLAEKDMEIRGVGNLLGPEQHGQISAVSIAVYTEMLAEEIAKLKGEEQQQERPVAAVDLDLDARLSPSYIQDDDVRIAWYGRLAETGSLAEVARISRELRETFGPMPTEVKTFVELVKLRLLAGGKGVASIKEHMTDIEIAFSGETVDYDARLIRELPFTAEATRYPPGFSVKKRGLKTGDYLGALSRVLYACG